MREAFQDVKKMSEIENMNDVAREREALLRKRVNEDTHLSSIVAQTPSHKFLCRSTQAVIIRQIDFLSALLSEGMNLAPPATKVLDWGCGKGHITYLLHQKGFEVTSCDLARSHDDSAFGQPTPIIDASHFQLVPLEDPVDLPFPSASFDCVVSFGVLEHVTSDAKSLVELRRVLRPGGLLFVAFLPYVLSWTQAVARVRGDNYHDRLYTRESIRDLAVSAGFTPFALRHAQLFPKNSVPLSLDRWLEPVDRFLCAYTPLKFFATNLELAMLATP